MDPKFARSVDRIIQAVLEVKEQVMNGAAGTREEYQERFRRRIQAADDELGGRPEWKEARYSLVCWIDDTMVELPWDYRNEWINNRLEFQMFAREEGRQVNAPEGFFLRAHQAQRYPNALEVAYLCVVLGFRGMYRGGVLQGFPPTIEDWARRTSRTLQVGQGLPPIPARYREPQGAPPLKGKELLLGSLMLFVILLAVTGSAVWFTLT